MQKIILFVGALLGVLGSVNAAGQIIPDPPVSLGQPARWRAAAGVQGGYALDQDADVYRAFANLTPEGLFPNLGLDFISLEGGLYYKEDDFDWDVGYYMRVPYVRLGLEYDFRDNGLDPVVSLQYGWRRGGLFHHGEEIRFDYRGRNNELMIGVVFNTTFRRYRATRPFSKTTDLPKGDIPRPPKALRDTGLPAGLEGHVQEVEHAIEWMDKLLTPRFFHGDLVERALAYRDHIRTEGHTFTEEDQRYHDGLRQAFAVASGDVATGEQLGTAAEKIIFDHIVAPYNGHFGEGKDPWQPTGYIQNAIEAFDTLLAGHSRFSMLEPDAGDGPRGLVREVFRRTVKAIDDAANESRARWKTNRAFWLQKARLVWLPLNYGLTPEQYDTQAEWDAITERLTSQNFSRTNKIEYMINERFHPELMRMINETEAYHVLLIHDFTGKNADGSPDPYGWGMVADGYMRAMINAVKGLDAGTRERFPQFMLFLDQNFYQSNRSRPIVTYMENIFETDDVKLDDGPVKTLVDNTHRELVATVRASKTFSGMDDERLAKLFKVHVTITNRWDPTFAFDIDKRDHRKIAFRDVFEDDPSRGEGILTGTGVGHHYHPPDWEDRALGIQGPVLIELKRTAEKLCRSQGYKEREIPEYLRAKPFPADYEAQCERLWDRGWRSNIMIVFNDTGYGEKKATVQRAVMYNLAPKKSVLLSIDSLWLSDFWAGMYVSAALRGAHVYAIAPSPANAPSTADFTMYLMQQNLEILLAARPFLDEDLAKVDGRIHVGLYAHDYGSDDQVARASAFLQNTKSTPFVLEDFPLDPKVFDVIRKFVEKWQKLEEGNETAQADVREVKPFLHMKTQFFATDVALDIMRQEQWVPIVERFTDIRTKQLLGEETEGMTPLALVDVDSTANQAVLQTEYERYIEGQRPDEADKAILAFTIGSMNQDRRGMLSDGEVLAVCSGLTALISVVDMIGTAVTATWPQSREELDELFPEPSVSTRTKRLARYLQDFF